MSFFKSFLSFFTKKDIFSVNKPIHKATETWLALTAIYEQEYSLARYYDEAATAVNPNVEWHYFAFLKDKHKEHQDNALLMESKVAKARTKREQLLEKLVKQNAKVHS